MYFLNTLIAVSIIQCGCWAMKLPVFPQNSASGTGEIPAEISGNKLVFGNENESPEIPDNYDYADQGTPAVEEEKKEQEEDLPTFVGEPDSVEKDEDTPEDNDVNSVEVLDENPITDDEGNYGQKDTDDQADRKNENDIGEESEENKPSEGGAGEDIYVPEVHGGILFDSPFFNLEQLTRYLKQMERALEQVFRQTLDEAGLLNGTYANTTEEEVVINGHKYNVQKSIIKTGDNNSSIFIEAVEEVQQGNRTKRSNYFSEAATAKDSDP